MEREKGVLTHTHTHTHTRKGLEEKKKETRGREEAGATCRPASSPSPLSTAPLQHTKDTAAEQHSSERPRELRAAAGCAQSGRGSEGEGEARRTEAATAGAPAACAPRSTAETEMG